MVIEVVAGLLTGWLALLSDAGHMATDALGLGMALAAIVAAARAGTGAHRTFGLYRLEILAALANAGCCSASPDTSFTKRYNASKTRPRVENPPQTIVEAIERLGELGQTSLLAAEIVDGVCVPIEAASADARPSSSMCSGLWQMPSTGARSAGTVSSPSPRC